MNGEISGIETFLKLPQVIVDDYGEQIEEIKEHMRNDRENSETTG